MLLIAIKLNICEMFTKLINKVELNQFALRQKTGNKWNFIPLQKHQKYVVLLRDFKYSRKAFYKYVPDFDQYTKFSKSSFAACFNKMFIRKVLSFFEFSFNLVQ